MIISLLKSNLEVKKKIVNILLMLLGKYNFPFATITKIKLLILFIKYFKYYL